MKQFSFLLLILFVSCGTSNQKSKEQIIEKTSEIKTDSAGLVSKKTEKKPKQKLYLNGIYEYDYPNDTQDMNENQYIAFSKKGDTVKAWYFGTSDEFDPAREGYLPGYFVSQIQNLNTKGDSIFFSISVSNNQCYATRPPIGFVDRAKLDEEYEVWNYNNRINKVDYSGKLDGLKLYIKMFGEIRTYRKTRNYFHPGIDNYDETKCKIEPILAVHENMENLTSEIVLDFLNTFSVICEANVEFSEMSNEMLFRALLNEPELVLSVISDNSNQLDTTSILEELKSPLHDLIPTDSIKTKIESLNINPVVKKSVLKRLNSL